MTFKLYKLKYTRKKPKHCFMTFLDQLLSFSDERFHSHDPIHEILGVGGRLRSLETVLSSASLSGSPMIGVRDILMNVRVHFRGPCSVQTTGVAHLMGLPNALHSVPPTPHPSLHVQEG